MLFCGNGKISSPEIIIVCLGHLNSIAPYGHCNTHACIVRGDEKLLSGTYSWHSSSSPDRLQHTPRRGGHGGAPPRHLEVGSVRLYLLYSLEESKDIAVRSTTSSELIQIVYCVAMQVSPKERD